MTDRGQFETHIRCEACEAMCLDAVDGTLTTAEQAMFDHHIAGCMECLEQFAEAKRGAAWMEMLKGHRPEPPAGMLQRILAQTSEAEMSRVFPRVGVPTPVFKVVPVIGLREKMMDRFAAAFTFDMNVSHFQPRMAMTAAMAFFSIALTLNLAGVRLTDLKPGTIHRTVADAKASAARTFQNMRVVYQVESRVNELRDEHDPGGPFGSGGAAPKQQEAQPAPQGEKPKDENQKPHGTSELIMPGAPQMERVSGKDGQTAPDADAPRVQRGA